MTEPRPKGNASSGRVVVIGGGTAGLCAAYTLRKHGIKAIVLEAASRVGGPAGRRQGGRLHAG